MAVLVRIIKLCVLFLIKYEGVIGNIGIELKAGVTTNAELDILIIGVDHFIGGLKAVIGKLMDELKLKGIRILRKSYVIFGERKNNAILSLSLNGIFELSSESVLIVKVAIVAVDLYLAIVKRAYKWEKNGSVTGPKFRIAVPKILALVIFEGVKQCSIFYLPPLCVKA